MDRAGERVKVEEFTTVSYGERREMLFPWPLSWSAVWVGTLSAISLALDLRARCHRARRPSGRSAVRARGAR